MAPERSECSVVAHFDVDCFYAQSEELRRPSLQGRPVGITQKFLVVTCNYVARGLGVPKMAAIDEAKRKCPELVLINGEDLTPYRADSKRIMAVLRRYGTLERVGLDEGAVDITAQVCGRLESGIVASSFSGCVVEATTGSQSREGFEKGTDVPYGDLLLKVGSHVAAEIRAAIEQETGFQCSCGIAHNKMLAKLSSSLNKPNKQTCLIQSAVAGFLSPMPIRMVPGVGHCTEGLLRDIGVEKVSDLLDVPVKKLCQMFGERTGSFLFNACRGCDLRPVQDRGPPKSLSVEDSFKDCKSLQRCKEILRTLAPDFISRLDEDRDEYGRMARSITVKWRVDGTKWNFVSASTQMPQEMLACHLSVEKRASVAVETALRLLSNSLKGQAFSLRVINLGATNFINEFGSAAISDIRPFLLAPVKSPEKELLGLSKREARARRESFDRRLAVLANPSSAALPDPTSSFHDKSFQTITLSTVKGRLSDLDAFCVVDQEDQDSDESELWMERVHVLGQYNLSSLTSKSMSSSGVLSWGKKPGALQMPDVAAQSANCCSQSSLQEISKNQPAPEEPSLQEISKPCKREIREATSVREVFGTTETSDVNCPPDLMEQHRKLHDIGCVDVYEKFSPSAHQMMERTSTCCAVVECPKCREYVDGSEKGRQEHADYHFALELNLLQSSAERKGGTHQQKKARRSQKSLDSFVYRL